MVLKKKQAVRIYFGNALFSEAEQDYNKKVVGMIREKFGERVSVYSPVENTGINDKEAYADSRDIARADNSYLLESDVLVAVLDGASIDVGLASEIGVAYQAGIPIIGLYTDSRQSGATNTKKLNALQDVAESQFSYVNLYTVGLIKLNGKITTTIEDLVRELDFIVEAKEDFTNKPVLFTHRLEGDLAVPITTMQYEDLITNTPTPWTVSTEDLPKGLPIGLSTYETGRSISKSMKSLSEEGEK